MPNWEHIQHFRTLDQKYKQAQKENYDRRHRVRNLPELPENQPMWVDSRVQSRLIPGQVSHSATTPRSYVVETPSGELRRNRAHLRTRSDSQLTEAPTYFNKLFKTCYSPTNRNSYPSPRSPTILKQMLKEGRCDM